MTLTRRAFTWMMFAASACALLGLKREPEIEWEPLHFLADGEPYWIHAPSTEFESFTLHGHPEPNAATSPVEPGMKTIHMHGRWEIVSRLHPHYAKVQEEARESFLRAERSKDDPGQGGGVREASETLETPAYGRVVMESVTMPWDKGGMKVKDSPELADLRNALAIIRGAADEIERVRGEG